MVNQSRTTPYHPRGNGTVDRKNRMLGYALHNLSLERSQKEWDPMLPQIMRMYRITPHSSMQETPNLLIMGCKTSTSYTTI